jgi:hypothetical protein
MIFRLTKKSQAKLKTGKLSKVPENVLFNEWYINVFFSNRHRYFIISNAATLVTVIIPGAGIKNEADLFESVFDAMGELFNAIGCPFIFQRNIEPEIHDITLADTCNMKILGSMNDMVLNAKYHLEVDNMQPLDVSRSINETPFGYIGMETPSDFLKHYRLYA